MYRGGIKGGKGEKRASCMQTAGRPARLSSLVLYLTSTVCPILLLNTISNPFPGRGILFGGGVMWSVWGSERQVTEGPMCPVVQRVWLCW